MRPRLRFSLRTVLIGATLTIIGVYYFVPIPTEIYCDPMNEYSSRYNKTGEDILIDIEGVMRRSRFKR